MDDTCVVCAETLQWVAYGPCGHREVCSTCIIRLRFICDDYHCCICKFKSETIFVTKALGDYTRMITDFSVFPANPAEGQAGSYWYHEGTMAYFDDLDHYKLIKAMCRLSCHVCYKNDGQKKEGSKTTVEFNNVEQLKSHLFHRHRLFMCSLCLEGRKIFISEQKLYNRAQLNQHVKTGDSVVDGTESERCGFMGHPVCEFCQNPFYGDNELYLHMTTEHFTCHICQRRHPGQYEYHKDYDDLEIHFRQEHFLCEDEACLAKKFIVFGTESEMKRHNAMEHGGRMSRSKRNAVLQIPTSFQYRQSNELHRRHRGHGNHSNSYDNHLPTATDDNLEAANAERVRDFVSNTSVVSRHRERNGIELLVNSFESLATTDSEPSSRFDQVSGQNSGTAALEATSFPPLPVAASSSHHRSRNGLEVLRGNTMAARLRHKNTVKVFNFPQASPATSHHSNSASTIPHQSRPASDSGLSSASSSLSSSQMKLSRVNECKVSSHGSSSQARASTVVVSSNFTNSLRTSSSTGKVSHSASTPNVVDNGTSEKCSSHFAPLSNVHVDRVPTSSENVQSSNKGLVEKIRAALEMDDDKFAAFKVISADYRQDLIDTSEYLAYVHQFGLSHLVLELARLCPDAQKQKELVEMYNYNMRRNDSNENVLSTEIGQSKGKKSSKKGKEKCEDNGFFSSGTASAGSLSSSMKNLHSNRNYFMEQMGGCSSAKGKSKIFVGQQGNSNLPLDPSHEKDAQSAGGSSKKNIGAGGGGNKPRKKTSRFIRNRLGQTSAAVLLEAGNSDAASDENEEETEENSLPPELLSVRGVWGKGGGQRIVAMSHRNHKK